MTPEQRLQFIKCVEASGCTVETAEYRHGRILALSIRDGHGYVAHVTSANRFDWEELARRFYAWQQRGGRRVSREALAA